MQNFKTFSQIFSSFGVQFSNLCAKKNYRKQIKSLIMIAAKKSKFCGDNQNDENLPDTKTECSNPCEMKPNTTRSKLEEKLYDPRKPRNCIEDKRIQKNKNTPVKKVDVENIGDFNIFGEQCHWIRQLEDGEQDPTHDGNYLNHRMYHKYTYADVIEHLKQFRLPQPSNKRSTIIPKISKPKSKSPKKGKPKKVSPKKAADKTSSKKPGIKKAGHRKVQSKSAPPRKILHKKALPKHLPPRRNIHKKSVIKPGRTKRTSLKAAWTEQMLPKRPWAKKKNKRKSLEKSLSKKGKAKKYKDIVVS